MINTIQNMYYIGQNKKTRSAYQRYLAPVTCPNLWWIRPMRLGCTQCTAYDSVNRTYLIYYLLFGGTRVQCYHCSNEIWPMVLSYYIIFWSLIVHWYLCDSTSVVGLSTARSAYQRYLAPVTLPYSLMDSFNEIRLHLVHCFMTLWIVPTFWFDICPNILFHIVWSSQFIRTLCQLWNLT